MSDSLDRTMVAAVTSQELCRMFNDQDLGFFTNFLGIFIFVLAMAYHFVMADPKYEGN
ncbi:dolichyl-diphosphooligosaccharide--protein glycosyltransferase subunit 4A-like isoform X2 [Lolium perenne]|uniref:dolichyl-diphosphooligosaccharide--protein glycosyltransferase subunit 4A-like isoform X2 n=1 Tax=Lolium perenne TaxID=4522 RepID=UPI003A99F84F